MKKIRCFIFGHKWDKYDPYCERCEKFDEEDTPIFSTIPHYWWYVKIYIQTKWHEIFKSNNDLPF